MISTNAVDVIARGCRYVVICRHPDCGDQVEGTTVLACTRYTDAASIASGHQRAHTHDQETR